MERSNINPNEIFTDEEIEKMITDRSISYIDEDQSVILIDIKWLKDLLSGVGEGIQDVDVDSYSHYYKEWQNEIVVTYWDNAWGGIDSKEWTRLEKILDPMKGKEMEREGVKSIGTRIIS